MNITLIMCSILFMTTSLNASLHTNLITPDKKPTPGLLALLSICNIQHDGSLATIITATQKEQPEGFLRPKDKERWQVTSYLTAKEDKIRAQCLTLSMIKEIKPLDYNYEYLLLFGGTLEGVRTRVAFLSKLWHRGVRFKKIIVLTGQRLLDPVIESPQELTNAHNLILSIKPNWQLKNSPTTETDMIRMVFEQSIVPAAWQSMPIEFIDTPMQKRDGWFVRPNTTDTIQHWLTTHPIPGSLLAISEQPSIGYQDALLQRFLPASFTIETVGSAASKSRTKPEILIGTVGWWLYNAQFLY
jgi:hypothetical protein